MTSRLARPLFVIAAIVVAASLVASLAWAVITLGVRPLDGVEGDVLFEADRIRAGFALYTDPAIGAHEYGEPPARYLVLYPPLWSALLSLVPKGAAATFARVVSLVAWLGALAFVVRNAPRERRLASGAIAVLGASIWVLVLYGASGRPDALAVALSGLALERASRKGDVDVAAGVLFALAAWVKPNVIGAAPGAMVAALLATRRLRGIASAIATSAVVAGALHVASGGRWIAHLLASTGQPPDLSLLLDQLGSRLPFFVLPIGFALGCGWRARRDPGARIATAALATSIGWSLLCLAKIGSATNYFLEPMIAAAIVLARADVPPLSARGRTVLAGACVLQALWTGIASVKSAVKETGLAFERAQAVADARAICEVPESGVVLADEPGLERMLNGRVIATPFQSTHLARRGKLSLDAWIADVRRPEVGCLVMQDDLLERPLDRVSVAHDRFGPELRRVLASRFRLATERGGYRIYRASDREGGR